MNNNVGQYIERQVVSTPLLKVLSFEGMSNVHGPSAVEIMHVSLLLVYVTRDKESAASASKHVNREY